MKKINWFSFCLFFSSIFHVSSAPNLLLHMYLRRFFVCKKKYIVWGYTCVINTCIHLRDFDIYLQTIIKYPLQCFIKWVNYCYALSSFIVFVVATVVVVVFVVILLDNIRQPNQIKYRWKQKTKKIEGFTSARLIFPHRYPSIYITFLVYL